MPYEHLEEFLGRGDEKFFGPLSLSNLGGLLAGGWVGYQLAISLALPPAIVLVTTLVFALAGTVATWRVAGMTPLSRGFWLLRFLLRHTLDPSFAVVEAGTGPLTSDWQRPPLLLRQNGRPAAISGDTVLPDETLDQAPSATRSLA